MSQSNKIFQAIPKIMASVGVIAKGKTNSQQGYKFRGIDDIYQALQTPLAEHGVFYAPKVIEIIREERATKAGGVLIYTTLKVEFTFFADDGSSFQLTTVGEAMDSGDKSSNKAMSAALKYAILQLFCIPTEEPKDTENDSPNPLPRGVKPNIPSSAGPEKAKAMTEQLKGSAGVVNIKTAKPIEAEAFPEIDPEGDYVVPVKCPFEGKRIKDCNRAELKTFFDQISARIAASKKPVAGQWLEFLTRLEVYLHKTDESMFEGFGGANGQ